jgi:hypothetical protein
VIVEEPGDVFDVIQRQRVHQQAIHAEVAIPIGGVGESAVCRLGRRTCSPAHHER